MAIARGAGTEIIQTVNLTDVDSSAWYYLISGEQHHIYTVLSVVIHANSVNAAGNAFKLRIVGWDSKTAASGTVINLLSQGMNTGETFVFNDKFSMLGRTPVDWGTGALSTVAHHDAIADQGHSSGGQSLQCQGSHTADQFHVVITYIDQNNE